MATKKSTKLFRFKSDEVQGEGSFVVMRKVPWGPMRQAMSEKGENTTDEEFGMQMLQGMLPDLIMAWNWTRDVPKLDENGDLVLDEEGEMLIATERLRLPSQDPSVLDNLGFDEVMFLVDKASGLMETKKSEKNSS